MTKAELIAALSEVPDEAEIRVFVDSGEGPAREGEGHEDLLEREHNDALDVDYVDTYYAVGVGYITKTQQNPFVILRVKEADDD